MAKKERTIFHLELKSTELIEKYTKQHHYFGSIAAIFSDFTPEEINIKYNNLRNKKITDTIPFENAVFVLRKDILKTIEKGREKESE
jgi:hypothetical protein